jgi:hypothetical protein
LETIKKGDVRRYADALPLLAPEAFRYFLPAYMINCAENWADLDVAPSSLVFNLTPPTEEAGSAWDHFWQRARLFSADERACIVEFLELADAIERVDWASVGKQPPMNRVARTLEWWRGFGR